MVATGISASLAAVVVIGVLPMAMGPGPFMTNANPPVEAIKAKNCAMRFGSSPRDCDAKYPIIFFGEDVEEHRDLVSTAFGYGISPMLNYKFPGFRDGWYKGLISAGEVCGGTGAGTMYDCDEYPYRSTDQGGPANYNNGKVVLNPVYWRHNQNAGSMLYHRLISPCGIKPSSADPQHSGFVVVPLWGYQHTAGRCADGSYHGSGG